MPGIITTDSREPHGRDDEAASLRQHDPDLARAIVTACSAIQCAFRLHREALLHEPPDEARRRQSAAIIQRAAEALEVAAVPCPPGAPAPPVTGEGAVPFAETLPQVLYRRGLDELAVEVDVLLDAVRGEDWQAIKLAADLRHKLEPPQWDTAADLEKKLLAVHFAMAPERLRVDHVAAALAEHFNTTMAATRSWLNRIDPRKNGPRADPTFWGDLKKALNASVRANNP